MKLLKRMVSVFLSAVIAFGCLSGLTVTASAEAEIGYSVDYDYYGTAFLSLTPTDSGNYLTYTTDGTVPKANSTKYTGEIVAYYKTVFRIREYNASGKKVTGIKVIVTPKVANVEYDVEYGNKTATIELDCPTLGAKIYYTTDGTTPTKDSKLYLGEIVINKKTQIKAVAIKTDYKRSKLFSKTFSVKEDDADADEEDNTSGKLKAVRYSTTYVADKGYTYITLTPQKKTNVIYYTTDGSAPSKSSAKYKKRIKFTELTTLRAVEYTAKGEKVASIKLNVALKCAPVEFVCTDISVGTKMIELKTSTPGAKIYYSIDGKIPEAGVSPLYTGKLTLGDATGIKAIAVKDGYKRSSVKAAVVSEIPLTFAEFNINDPRFTETVAVVNRYRAANGLPVLKLNQKLTEAANVRAKELLALNDHYRPSGGYYTSIFTERNINVGANAEFIATYYQTPEELVAALLKNADNQVMISKGYNFNSIGVGYYEYGESRYWTIIIGEM